MKAVMVGTCRACTHAVSVCTRWPSEHYDPGHSVLRREPTGVATIVTMRFEKVNAGHYTETV